LKYLLDTNVIKEIGRPVPHQNVAAWFDGVDDSDLAISVISVREIFKGVEKKRKTDRSVAEELAEAANRIFAAYVGRIIPIDEAIAKCWGEMLGRSDKHTDDTGLAATAKVRGLIVVNRNESDFEGRGVRVINPFKAAAKG
jgi:predicted nucleic acid-binding protein